MQTICLTNKCYPTRLTWICSASHLQLINLQQENNLPANVVNNKPLEVRNKNLFSTTILRIKRKRPRKLHKLIQAASNLRSGSYFRFALKITFRRARRNEKRGWYKPSTKRLPPTFLIDWHLPNQPTKITSVACFFSMQIFHTWEKCRLADLKKILNLLIFFQLKIKRSAQSHLTSCEIKEDLEGYFCWRRR